MPPSRPDVDALLLEFLYKQKDLEDRDITLATVHSVLMAIVDRVQIHEKQDAERFSRLDDDFNAWKSSADRRMISLEKDIQHLTRDVDRVEEQSGSHDIPAILNAAAAAKSRRPSSNPPSGLAKLMSDIGVKTSLKVAAILAAAVVGWLSSHIQFH